MNAKSLKNVSASKKRDITLNILVAYLVFEYLRIQDSIFPFLSPLKIPSLLVLVLFIIVLKRMKGVKFDLIIILSLLFLFEMAIWVPFANNNHFAFHTTKNMAMTIISLLAIIIIVDSKEKLLYILKSMVIIFFMLSLWAISHGGKGPGGFVADENDVCLVLVTALPFAWYLAQLTENSKKETLFYQFICVVLIIGVISTSSRGGSLGLIAALATIVWLSRKRWRNIFSIILVSIVMGSALISMLPDAYVKDMRSINATDDDTRDLRYLHWTTAWEMFKDNPVLGVGPLNYPWRSNEYFHLSSYYDPNARNRSGRQTHSLYLTLLPELGFLGTAFYFSIVYSVLKFKVIGVARRGGEREISILYKKMIYASLAGFFVSSLFISVLYYPIFWHIAAFSYLIKKYYYDPDIQEP